MKAGRAALRRGRISGTLAPLFVLIFATAAQAYWTSTHSGNPAAAAADVLPQAATPTVSAMGNEVTLDFVRAATAQGRPVTSYLVKRYETSLAELPSGFLECTWPLSSELQCADSGVPYGTWYYTVTAAIGASEWLGAQSAKSSSILVDTTAPIVTSTVIAKELGYLAGSIKQAGRYYLYAKLEETGSGVQSVTADLSTITSGATSVILAAGSYSANGVVYNYRSTLLDATAALTGGNTSKTYTITSTDELGNQQAQGSFGVSVDNTVPAATDVQTSDGGGAAGRAQSGDRVTFTFSEPIDPQSVLPGWTGTSTSVTVRLIDGGCTLLLICSDDSLQIYNASNTAPLPLGTVDLNRADYHGGLNLAGSQPTLCSAHLPS